MKKILLLASVIGLVMTNVCCKSKKEGSSSSTSTTETKTQKYRLMVTFISKGAGTDAAKREEFLKFVESHAKKPANVKFQWGREGETDYCLTLTELSKSEQTAFVDAVKKIANGSDMMLINENTVCTHEK